MSNTNFNSTMVRLKEQLAERGIPVSTAFQFHYGTIKRRLYSLFFSFSSLISIPLWYD